MELTVGYLKKVLAQVDDSVVLAHLGVGNHSFEPILSVKRLMVLADDGGEWGGKTFLTINELGSHFTGKGEQLGLKFTGVYFDEDSFNNK